MIGPAWTGRGRPAAGYFTKRTAEAWLSDVLDEARRGTLPGAVRTGATFADAAAEYLRYIEVDRGRKATTVQDYRSVIETHLLPAFGDMRLEDITAPMIERWLGGLQNQRSAKRPAVQPQPQQDPRRSPRRLPARCPRVGPTAQPGGAGRAPPAAGERRHRRLHARGGLRPRPRGRQRARRGDLRRRGVHRAAHGRAAGAALARRRLRGARRPSACQLRQRRHDHAQVGQGALGAARRRGRRVARPARPRASITRRRSTRLHGGSTAATSPTTGCAGATARRSQRARLRPLRFHDLRHTFGSLAISRADIVEVQAWMGHADVKTTMRYLHYRDRADAAARLNAAFETGTVDRAIDTAGL